MKAEPKNYNMKLKKNIATLALLATTSSFAIAGPNPLPYTSTEADSPFQASVYGTYASDYSYRGLSTIFESVFKKNTSNAMGIGADLHYDLTENISIVSNFDVTWAGDAEFSHTQASIGLAYTTETFYVAGGYRYHYFDNVFDQYSFLDDSTTRQELFLEAGYTIPWVEAQLKGLIAFDIDNEFYNSSNNTGPTGDNGTYYELTLEKRYEINDMFAVKGLSGISYSDNYSNGSSDWNNWFLTLSAPITPIERLVVSPYVTYQEGMDAITNTSTGENALWIGGVEVKYSF